MKNAILIDSGPLVALFHARDKYNSVCIQYLKTFNGRLISCLPVITESLYLLSFSIQAQENLLIWIERGGIELVDITLKDFKYIKDRMKKYNDLPMDFADACLMCIAEREGIGTIFSIDSDFSIYRTLKGKQLKGVLHRKGEILV